MAAGEEVDRVDLAKTGLYDHKSAQKTNCDTVWYFRKGKPIAEAGNFTVCVLGNYESEDECGRIFKVIQKWPSYNEWEAPLNFSEQSNGESAYVGLNNKHRLHLDRKYLYQLSQYLRDRGIEYERELISNNQESKQYLLIKNTGCHKKSDGTFVYIFTQYNSNELLVINEEGIILHNMPVFLKVDQKCKMSEYGYANESERFIFKEIVHDFLLPEVNRPVVILTIGWFLCALHGVRDDNSNTILLNLYGDGSAGKTTLIKALSGAIGTVNLLRYYTPSMLVKQCQYTTLPVICNDPPPNEKWMSEMHDVASQIADKLQRKVNNYVSTPVAPAGIVSNFKDWDFDKHQSLLSRSINLFMEAPSNKMKEEFGTLLSDWVKRLKQTTCLQELIEIRHIYKNGAKKERFAEIQQLVDERFKPIFANCVSRSKDETYPIVLEYAMIVLDYVDEFEKGSCVWPYLHSICSLHRQPNAGDVLEEFETELKLNWEQVVSALDLHDAVRRLSYYCPQAPVLCIATERAKKVFPDFVVSLGKVVEKSTLTTWKDKYHFIKDFGDSSLKRISSNKALFTSIACFKIPKEQVPNKLDTLIREAWKTDQKVGELDESNNEPSEIQNNRDNDDTDDVFGNLSEDNNTVFGGAAAASVLEPPSTPLRALALNNPSQRTSTPISARKAIKKSGKHVKAISVADSNLTATSGRNLRPRNAKSNSNS